MNPEQFHIDIQNIKGAIIDRVLVMRTANLGLIIIRERTTSGKFLPGSSSGAEMYSTKPFAMPYGAVKTNSLKNELRRNIDTGVVFTKGTNQLWILIKGGYKKYRELAGKDTSKVSLIWSGRMMRNLGILNAGENEATLGEKDADTKLLASYHNTMGAGKSKRLHKFLGFTDKEIQKMTDFVGDEVMKRLRVMDQ